MIQIEKLNSKLPRSKVSFEEWKRRVEDTNELELVDIFYRVRKDTKRNETWLKIRHKQCGKEFDRVSNCMTKNKRQYGCPYCGNKLSVSHLHATIATIAKAIYIGSKTEYDIGFKGKKGKASCYDLFIPNLKGKNTLIEFQSRYHDGREDFDNEKRQFAINNGYQFMSYDNRIDLVENVAMKLFGNIDISSYSDLNTFYKYKFSFSEVQEKLNKYTPIVQVARELNVTETLIRNMIKNKKVKLPDNFIKVVTKSYEIVQMTMDGEFIECFKNQSQAYKKLGIKPTMETVTHDNVVCFRGFAWIRKEYYDKGDYKIPDFAQNHVKTFYEIDKNNNIIKTYTNLKNAMTDIGITSVIFIKDALKHKKDNTKGHKYIFKYEYENKQQNVYV